MGQIRLKWRQIHSDWTVHIESENGNRNGRKLESWGGGKDSKFHRSIEGLERNAR